MVDGEADFFVVKIDTIGRVVWSARALDQGKTR